MSKLLPSLALPLLLSCVPGDPGPAGPMGDPGPAGPAGPPGSVATIPPTLTGLTPLSVFPDRAMVLQVSGIGTHFVKESVLRFTDPAITVGKLTVGGPGYLQAEVQVGVGATLGPHDLTVEGPGVTPTGTPSGTPEMATLHGALVVAPSLLADASGTSAMAVQGGLFDFSLTDLDRQTPFAGAARLDGGARMLYSATLGSRISGYGLVDALAPAGGMPLRVTYSKGTPAVEVSFVSDGSASASPQVTSRAAKVLTDGTAITGETLAMPRQTNLYKLTTTADRQVVVLSLATSGGLATNTVAGAMAPASGKWNEGQFLYASTNAAAQTALAWLPQKGDQYLTVLAANLGGGADYAYGITAKVATAMDFSTKENAMMADTPAMPLATLSLSGPQHSGDGALDGPADFDYIKVQPSKTGRLYAQAVAPSQGLATPAVAVALMQADCVTALAPPRPVQQEAAVVAGTSYCVVLSSPSSYSGPYQLLLAQDP